MKITPIFPIVVLSIAPIAPPSIAQLIPDNTLGPESSVVTPVGQTGDRIDGGAVRGSNLFHSFQEFNVDAGRKVDFANPTGIENILTRVTGGNPSNIFGTLGVLGESKVNLFLVNPNGIIFGPNASLDISGSFFATTSPEIKLGPTSVFSATNPDRSQLLNIQPEAIFTNALANHMAQINNQADLAVGVGSTLALQGGEVTLTGSLTASGGTVMVLGERVGLLDNARIDVSGPTGGGWVSIGAIATDDLPTAERTYIGKDVTITADALETGDGGTVIARAGEVTGFYGQITARGGRSSGNGGQAEISGNVHLIFRGQVDASAVNGNPGTLHLETTDILIGDGARITNDNLSADDILKAPLSEISSAAPITIYSSDLEEFSGNMQVRATKDILVADLQDDLLELAGETGEIALTADGDNDGVGDIVIEGAEDSISTQGRDIDISGANVTFGISFRGETGDLEAIATSGGAITINATNGNIVVENLDSSSSIGAGGEVKITAQGDIATGDITTSSLSRAGAGAIAMAAGGNITTGELITSVENDDGGSGGNIDLTGGGNITTGEIISRAIAVTGKAGNAGSLMVTAGGNIDISGISLSSTSLSSVEGGGSGGNIILTAGGDIITFDMFSKSQSGPGGDILALAGGDILVSNGIFSDSEEGNEDGGEISMTSSNGSIAIGKLTSPGGNGGGNITLTAKKDITFISSNSEILEINASGNGRGGNISFTSQTGEILIENYLITSNAGLSGTTDSGNGGSISLAANSVILKNVDVSTTSGRGNSGAIAIDTPREVTLDRARLFTGLEPDAIGDGGNIEITAGSVSLRNSTFIDTATSGGGNAGNVTIRADSLDLNNSSIFSITSGEGNAGNVTVVADAISLSDISDISTAVDPKGIGNGGEINLFGRSLSLTGGSQLQALTRGEGNSGTIEINITDETIISGIGNDRFVSGMFTSTEGENSGRGNSISIRTGRLLVNDGAVVSAETNSPSAGGNIAIAANTLELRNGGQLLTNAFSSGEAGNITVNVQEGVIVSGVDPNLALRMPPPRPREPQITAPSSLAEIEPNNNLEEAQAISEFSLDSQDNFNSDVEFPTRIPYVSIAGTGSDPATVDYYSISVKVPGTRGTFDIDNGTTDNDADVNSGLDTVVSLFDGEGNLLASNDNASPAFGAAGSSRPSDSYLKYGFSTPGTYFIKVENARNSGTIAAPATYDLQVSLDTPNVTGTVVNAEAASGMFARTSGPGAAGNITINTGSLQVRSGGRVSAATRGDGNGGNLRINATEQITLTSGSSFSSQTTGNGNAGSLVISTDKLTISEDGEATVSSTGTGSAGSLILSAGSAIELDNGTLSAATEDVGDLGNINLTSPFIRLSDNSLITTNAANIATGGNITINTDFPIARDNSDISANGVSGFGDVNIVSEGIFLDNDSEITATGEVRINGVINPAIGLVEFQESPIDPEKIIAQNFCVLAKESSFIITGRGGIALNPGDYLTGEGTRVGLVDPVTGENSSTSSSQSPENTDNDMTDNEIRQAQGWVQLPDGTIVLTSYPVISTPHGPLLQHPGCSTVSSTGSITIEE